MKHPFTFSSIASLVILTILSNTLAVFGQTNRNPVYFGYEITYSMRTYQVNSNISKIDGLLVIQEGATVGVKWSTPRATFRGFAGAYYSNDAVPYSFDLLEAGVTGSYYLLRDKQAKYHTFEPYALLTMHYQQTNFFGNYLNEDGGANASTSMERKLGNVSWISPSLGAGVEFQLENDNRNFLHFFIEGKAGLPFQYYKSSAAFSKTTFESPFSFSIGVSFGKFKYRGFRM